MEWLEEFGWGTLAAQPLTIRYVSPSSSGSGALGTQADPWSLAELQTAIQNGLIPANTEIRFERDEVFEGTLTIDDLDGTESGPIKFLADPTTSGALPIFSGSKAVPANSWTSYATNPTEIWQVHLNTLGVSDVFNVYDSGELQTVAREPDAGFYRATTYSPGSGTLTSDDLATDPIDWTGGGVLVLRHVNWAYMNRVVTSDAGTSIGYPAISANTGGTDWGFYLQNKLEALDTPGEWYLAGAGGSDPVLYYAPLTSGQPQNVRIAVRQRGIQVWPTGSGCSYLEFRDLVFEHYADAYYRLSSDPNPLGVGIKIKSGSHHIMVDHCTFRDLRIGIDDQDNPLNRPHDNTYTNNTFARVYRNALKLDSDVATVQYNTITEVGKWSGQAGNDYNGNTALFSTGDDVLISWNTLSDLGGAGIGLNGMRLTPDRHVVEHNSIRNASLSLNDHGAITFDKCEALTIRNNLVDGMQPFTASSATDANSSDRTVGVYFGEGRIVDVHVERNTITGCGTGILLDHTYQTAGIKISANTIFNCRDAQLAMQDYGIRNSPGAVAPFYWPGYNTVFEGNVLYSLRADSWPLYQKHDYSTSFNGTQGLVNYGTFKGNYYFNPFNELVINQHTTLNTNNGIGLLRDIPYTLDGWRELDPQRDIGSVASPLRQLDFTYTLADPEVELVGNSDFETDLNGWDWAGSCGTAVAFDGSVGMQNTGCEWISEDEEATWVTDALNGSYLLELKVRSDRPGALKASAYFTSVQENNPPGTWIPTGSAIRNLKTIIPVDISSTATWSGGYLLMHDIEFVENIRTKTTTVDDLRLRKLASVTPLTTQIALDHILRYNCPNADPSTQNIHDPQAAEGTPSEFSVPGDPGQCWSDVYGNFYASGDEIELAEWASIVLFKFDAPTTFGTANVTTQITGQSVWTEPKNVLGRISIASGASLTIDGAHIGFAESTPSFANNITVLPGGTLTLKNGATLRSWMGCDGPAAMWDGVKVLGNGTTDGAGLLVMESGARIADAYTAVRCAEGEVGTIFGGDNNTGGIVQATDAIFENNEYDVVTRPHLIVFPNDWGPSSFTRCTFRRTRALHDATAAPGARISLMGSAPTEFLGCTLENTSGLAPSDPSEWGFGIHAINTRIRVVRDGTADKRGSFKGLSAGILHSAYEPTALAVIDECDFSGNGRGVLLWGTENSILTRCAFGVADVQVEDLSVEGAYGAYLYGCSGFEVEENTFVGPEGTKPTVGLVLRDCQGDPDAAGEDNKFYNNTFNGFANSAGNSAGTVIMGTNAGTDGVGLRSHCNDYSATGTNDYDLAFTGLEVSIANQQGSTGDGPEDPAGNTFANVDQLTCDGNEERHLFVQDILNPFTYWHHQPQTAVELVPHCSNAPNTNSNSTWPYFKPTSCPVDLSNAVPIVDDDDAAADAHAEHDALVEVYADWTDGGNTTGLEDFIGNSANDSYAVRNRLMLVAPSVSSNAWGKVFTRVPAMNPWHLAQALLANSPLEPAVLAAVDTLPIYQFYKELVYGGQSGISMHSIYQSEIAHWYSAKSTALQAMVRKALLKGDPMMMAMARDRMAACKMPEAAHSYLALYLAEGDLSGARSFIDQRLQDPGDLGYWQVQDLLLALKETEQSPLALDGNGITLLHDITAAKGAGYAQASAWLTLLGEPRTAELVILPAKSKSRKPEQERTAAHTAPMLSAYPNPSNGPVYLTYTVAEGVSSVELRLHDAAGRMITKRSLGASSGIAEIPRMELTNGLVLATLHWDGIQVGVAQVIITR